MPHFSCSNFEQNQQKKEVIFGFVSQCMQLEIKDLGITMPSSQNKKRNKSKAKQNKTILP